MHARCTGNTCVIQVACIKPWCKYTATLPHRAKSELRRQVQAHHAALTKLETAHAALQGAKEAAAAAVHAHMQALQKELYKR